MGWGFVEAGMAEKEESDFGDSDRARRFQQGGAEAEQERAR